MEPGLIAAIAIAAAATLFAVFALGRARNAGAALKGVKTDLTAAKQELETEKASRIRAETQFESATETIAALKAENASSFVQLNTAKSNQQEAETQAALDRQSVAAMEKRMGDWEKTQAEMTTHSKAALVSAGQEMLSKVFDANKKESAAQKKQSEEQVKKTTEALTHTVEKIGNSVTLLNDQVRETRRTADTVWRALSSPGGAGYYSEIGLENTLKSVGLERGRDFVLEHTITDVADGKRLRPDAIVFLPSDSLLVIDSKASKFFLELAEAEDEEEQVKVYANLSKTMNQHLRGLAAKDYQRAILDSYRSSGREAEVKRITSVMYLPNEGALEKLRIADPQFDQKTNKHNILLAGPTGLRSIIGMARVQIDMGRQAENQEQIVDATQQLLESLGIILSHVDSVGKGLKSATKNFGNLTGSINSRLLPRANKLVNLGVRPGKNRSLPNNLPTYQVIESSDPTVIEGEAEEVPTAALTDGTETKH